MLFSLDINNQHKFKVTAFNFELMQEAKEEEKKKKTFRGKFR